ncbi:hypothetical protein SPBR_07908 [Sporothrix brasiliensis 5110]|uniref:ATP synthase subunit K, mitochondrial n=1 Tax=Sporothrix brasiliensis 5110 TaxID=1398154 RepID=A0A0C2ER49_9PEZI|nr:uncharacterized protein SPBR_07908 [Sporothrix brasiliensis 5110]KIH88839.1 hypothetical protein SPBR_07908 [Sporothrix brasiliensis 5110]
MVQSYTIAGRQIGSHYLAIATLSTLFGGIYAATRGSGQKTTATPPINASSSDEADFIKKFLESADADEKKNQAAH